MMKIQQGAYRATAIAVIASMLVSGCAIPEIQRAQSGIADEAKNAATSRPQSRPVNVRHEMPWLLGDVVPASKPQPAIYSKPVEYRYTDTLQGVADWISRNVGVRAIVDPSAVATTSLGGAPFGVPTAPPNAAPLPAGAPGEKLGAAVVNVVPQIAPMTSAAMAKTIRYTGATEGFLNVVNSTYGVYSKYVDGVITFYRTETRTFNVADLASESDLNGSITTNSSSTSSSTSSAGTAPSGSGSPGGGQTATFSAKVNLWRKLKESVQAIAGQGVPVDVNPDLNIITVTGTPPQCDRVENFVKVLNGTFGKRIAVDVVVYEVHLNQNENHGFSLDVAYKSGSGHTGIKVAGAPVPKISGGASGMSFGANILSGPMAGTSAALQALSSVGKVSQRVSSSGVAQNGKYLALQSATDQDYVSSTQSVLAANVGASSSMQTSTVTPGFTSQFIPKLVDGRILMSFDLTLSNLIALEPYPPNPASGQSSVQLRKLQKSRFQQSVSLRPGEALVITGMYQQSANVTQNGVGSPSFPLLGGGIDAAKQDTVLAIVISASVI